MSFRGQRYDKYPESDKIRKGKKARPNLSLSPAKKNRLPDSHISVFYITFARKNQRNETITS